MKCCFYQYYITNTLAVNYRWNFPYYKIYVNSYWKHGSPLLPLSVFSDDDDLQPHGSMVLLKIQTPCRYKEIAEWLHCN